ncbi:MAG: hypothetical protein QXQ14_00070 [Candidatus Aenigmatarchaeota archaeon]
MRALTTLEIVIILVILIVTALFILSWLGIGTNPLDWFKKESIRNTFCGEVLSRANCQVQTYKFDEYPLKSDDTSTRIKCKDIAGKCVGKSSEDQATFEEICNYLGYTGTGYNFFKTCLEKACGCKFT